MRRVLLFVAFALLVAGARGAAGCGGGGSSSPGDSALPGPDSDPNADGIGDDGGALPPIPNDDGGAAIPTNIRYVIVLVKENHTFDNYFTGFPGAESATTGKLSTGATITRPNAPNGPLPSDLCHANSCGQTAYRNGAMNGFDLNNGGSQLPYVKYTEQQLPNYWQYARNFVLADHLFSTTLGPSTPGHAVFWSARSLSLDNATCATPDGGGCTGFGCTATRARPSRRTTPTRARRRRCRRASTSRRSPITSRPASRGRTTADRSR